MYLESENILFGMERVYLSGEYISKLIKEL